MLKELAVVQIQIYSIRDMREKIYIKVKHVKFLLAFFIIDTIKMLKSIKIF